MDFTGDEVGIVVIIAVFGSIKAGLSDVFPSFPVSVHNLYQLWKANQLVFKNDFFDRCQRVGYIGAPDDLNEMMNHGWIDPLS